MIMYMNIYIFNYLPDYICIANWILNSFITQFRVIVT